jgi:hypothetical protein
LGLRIVNRRWQTDEGEGAFQLRFMVPMRGEWPQGLRMDFARRRVGEPGVQVRKASAGAQECDDSRGGLFPMNEATCRLVQKR